MSNDSAVVELARQLIRRPSVTPDDRGCMELIFEFLGSGEFDEHQIDYGATSNRVLLRERPGRPSLLFAGHTDVVPPGDESAWRFPPFEGRVSDGVLYGRGACDMKGALAAYAVALRDFLRDHPEVDWQLGLLLTSDEEGSGEDGIKRVMQKLKRDQMRIDHCLIGEPTSSRRLGDMIKVGRRGSLNGSLTIYGRQGHIAYTDKADSPIHKAIGVLSEMTQIVWDEGSEDFQPSALQISNIHAGLGVTNVAPGECRIEFNIRYSPKQSAEKIQSRIEGILDSAGIHSDLNWHESGRPFLGKPGGVLRTAVHDAVEAVCGEAPIHSTDGGTSDGRHIAPYGAEVIELGMLNETAHAVNECVPVEDLERLTVIYRGILERMTLRPAQ
ncbi:MAG: succinyl-diaminopimelate desuccinylase [Gammaproteobacteria bacterium AqS3]|nr:succinyl-diaminopimelate desuccinylase [Gammaproteobacteria bacterium AqS3]